MRPLLLLALLPLAGCGFFGPRTTATEEPLTPEQRECRAEAQTSPGMKALDRQRMPMNSYNEDRLNREERVVLNRAYLDCLRARGLALPGGVQTVQPR